MKNKQQTPQRNLRRFALWGGPGKRTFRFTRRNTSFYFFGTLRFADYTWAIFNMMGFYPDCPGEPAYTLSTPVFDKVTIKLDPKYWGRDQLVIETERPSAESLYIREMELGGKKLSRYRITHEELVQSGKLRFSLR